MKTCICAIAKMEELYIKEWIEHYKNIGIDHIVIGDNNNSNYKNPLQPVIQDYIDNGYVTILNYNDLNSSYDFVGTFNGHTIYKFQIYVYSDMYKKYCDKYDWIFFIDIDEFIELPAYNNDIKLFLSDEKFKYASAILFPWLIYGDNEQLYYENKPLKERFVIATHNDMASVKTAYNCKKINFNIFPDFRIMSCHQPQNKSLNTNTIYNSLGENNFKVYDRKLRDINNSLSCTYYNDIVVTNKKYYDEAYIAHYMTKSTEEYIKYKYIRGCALQDKFRYNKYLYFSINKETKEKINLFNSLIH